MSSKKIIYHQGTSYWWMMDEAVRSTIMHEIAMIMKSESISSVDIKTNHATHSITIYNDQIVIHNKVTGSTT